MTNKELAVQLYSAIIQCAATVSSSPNFKGTVKIPSLDDAVEQVAQLTEKLSSIENKEHPRLKSGGFLFLRLVSIPPTGF